MGCCWVLLEDGCTASEVFDEVLEVLLDVV